MSGFDSGEKARQAGPFSAGIAEGKGTHVVLGAGGPLGQAVVRSLLSEAKDVRQVYFRRDESGAPPSEDADVSRADPFSSTSVLGACKGALVLYDCFEPGYTGWKTAQSEVAGNVTLAAIEVGAAAVFASHVMTSPEDNEKTESEVLRAEESGLIRTTVARFPQLYGPGVMNPLFKPIYDAALQGKKAHWIGDLEVQRSFLDVEDAARAMVMLGGSPAAQGKAWSVSAPTPLTGREFIELAFKAAGNEPKVGKWGRGIVLTGSLLASGSREILGMPYDYYSPFVLDGSGFAEAFPSFSYTSPEKSMGAALAWYKEREKVAEIRGR